MAVIKLKISDEQYKQIEHGKLNVALFNKEELEDSSAGTCAYIVFRNAAVKPANGGYVIPKDYYCAKNKTVFAGAKALKKALAAEVLEHQSLEAGYAATNPYDPDIDYMIFR